MRVLQAVQKSFDRMGFSPKQERFNHLALGILVTNITGTSLQWIFLFRVANSSQEYMESVYFVTATTCIDLSFAHTIFITKKLFSLIDTIDELFNERK